MWIIQQKQLQNLTAYSSYFTAIILLMAAQTLSANTAEQLLHALAYCIFSDWELSVHFSQGVLNNLKLCTQRLLAFPTVSLFWSWKLHCSQAAIKFLWQNQFQFWRTQALDNASFPFSLFVEIWTKRCVMIQHLPSP